MFFLKTLFSSVQLSSVTQSCPTLCDPMNHSTPGTLAKVTTKPEESPHLPPPSLNFPEPESAVTKWIPALLWDEA